MYANNALTQLSNEPMSQYQRNTPTHFPFVKRGMMLISHLCMCGPVVQSFLWSVSRVNWNLVVAHEHAIIRETLR